jgi:enamine deaminase RidA (YjgF/YER057c/UK114 family)
LEIEKRIKELGLELPPPPSAAAVYVPAVLSGEYIFVAGQTPKNGTELVYKGKVGDTLTANEGYEAAKICALRCISAVKGVISDLDRVEKIVQMTGYVNCSDDFEQHSLVINGASELLETVFGENGKHSRVAVGSNSLPGQAAVEIQMIVKIK